MKISDFITEAMLFSDFHEIKVDPDRDDLHDIQDKLLPVIVKMAYKNLFSDKEKHERKHGPKSTDEDAYNFEFTESALAEEVEAMLNALGNKLKELNSSDIKSTIKAVSKDFKDPLE